VSESQLREHLERLHTELEETDSVDDEARRLLVEVMQDIRAVLDRSDDEPASSNPSLADRLAEATQRFEESHPTLAAMVGRVADTLSNLGI
jgi:hypothetical protein